MDHDAIVEQLLARCKGFMENIWQAADLRGVATASLAIVEQMRQVAREMLQAKVHREAEHLKRAAVTPCGQEAGASAVQTRAVSPQTLWGEGHIPVRTFPCEGCGASLRPDNRHLGVPEGGDFTDDGRALCARRRCAAPSGGQRPRCAVHGRGPQLAGGSGPHRQHRPGPPTVAG